MTKRYDFTGETDDTLIVAGDDKELVIQVPNIPSTQHISNAWFVVRSNDDPDSIDPPILTKAIDETNQIGIGQITDNGGTTHIALIRIDLTETDTPLLLVPDPDYGILHNVYGLRVESSTGKKETALAGDISAWRDVTRE